MSVNMKLKRAECSMSGGGVTMTNAEKLKELFPDIPEHSGIDYWGDFWDEEYKDPKDSFNSLFVQMCLQR